MVDDDVLQRLIDLGVARQTRWCARHASRALGAIGDPRGLPTILHGCSRQARGATTSRPGTRAVRWRVGRRSVAGGAHRSRLAGPPGGRGRVTRPPTAEQHSHQTLGRTRQGLRGCSPPSRREHSYATSSVDRASWAYRSPFSPPLAAAATMRPPRSPRSARPLGTTPDTTVTCRHAGRAAEVRSVHARERHQHGRPDLRRRRQPDRRRVRARFGDRSPIRRVPDRAEGVRRPAARRSVRWSGS